MIVVDDFAGDVKFSRNSKLLHSLFTRGRHSQISTIVATQKFNSISPIIRVNASDLYVFRLRNYSDLQAFLEEVSAIAPKDVILQMYNLAIDEPYSFLSVKLTSKDKSKLFMIRFDKRLTFNFHTNYYLIIVSTLTTFSTRTEITNKTSSSLNSYTT